MDINRVLGYDYCCPDVGTIIFLHTNINMEESCALFICIYYPNWNYTNKAGGKLAKFPL